MSEQIGITLRISKESAAEIATLAERNGYSLRDFFLWGASLAKLVLQEHEQNNALILINENGRPLSKIVLPPSPSGLLEKAVRELLSEPYSLSLERAIADLDPAPDRTNKNREWVSLPPAF